MRGYLVTATVGDTKRLWVCDRLVAGHRSAIHIGISIAAIYPNTWEHSLLESLSGAKIQRPFCSRNKYHRICGGQWSHAFCKRRDLEIYEDKLLTWEEALRRIEIWYRTKTRAILWSGCVGILYSRYPFVSVFLATCCIWIVYTRKRVIVAFRHGRILMTMS